MALVENVLKNHEIRTQYIDVIIQSKNGKVLYWGGLENYNFKFQKFEVLEQRIMIDKTTLLLQIDFSS